MLFDFMGGIVFINDGYVIFCEIEVLYFVVKSMIEFSWMQDEEVGDGIIIVIILGGL